MGRPKGSDKRPIEQYDHKDKERVNNPPVGLVTAETDRDSGKQKYQYDPHLDPQLVWAGKAEHTSFDVPIVSLHVHERIDPKTIIEAVKKKNGKQTTLSFFSSDSENPPLRDAIEFYKHSHGWSNRLIAGDSLLVMNSLIQKEGLAGKVQMVYIDPPYGIKYGSNFQPFVNKRDVKNGKDEDLTAEPETIKAFRDTWELGIHSYITYLRDRLLIAKELLTESGSVFVQISDENVHHVREIMDEVFGCENFVSQITFRKKLMPLGAKTLECMADFLLWYAHSKPNVKYRQLYRLTEPDPQGRWTGVEEDGKLRRLTKEERADFSVIRGSCRLFGTVSQWAPSFSESNAFDFEYKGSVYRPTPGQCWVTSKEKMNLLGRIGRLFVEGDYPRYVIFHNDFPYAKMTNPWDDTAPTQNKIYVVQTNEQVISRCLLMTTDPGDLIFDPTCGSGTTAYVAEHWGRRWLTCDTSRVAITLAKQRLMTAVYDYYELAHPEEGVGSGFNYTTIPHTTLKSIVNNPEIKEGMSRTAIDKAIAKYAEQETLYDQPFMDTEKVRVAGPFTVEAVPAPTVRPLSEIGPEEPKSADITISRSGETLRQSDWKDELFRTGIRGKGGQKVEFTRLETLAGARWLHVDGETKEAKPQRVVVSFGPEHAPLEQRQVELALEDARKLVPKPTLVVFAAFEFDPEAAKDIDETKWPGVTLLRAQMNADLLTADLKKARSSNESFWLMGQPDVDLEKIKTGPEKGKYKVTVHGFDYYNTRTGNIESGGTDKIAMWLLDTDYDGRSLFPRQVFFPMAGEKDAWARLARNLKAEIDEERIEAYRGIVSLPFELGEYRKVAVKIVDDRGIESLKIIEVE